MSDGRHGKDEATSIVAWLQAKVERLTADMDRLERDLAERERLDQVTFAADSLPAAAGDQTGPLPRIPAQRQPASHRVPKEQRWLKVVPGFIPALGALRWAWHAHRAATTVAGTVLTVTAATTTAAVVTTQPAHGSGRAAATASAPAGIDWSATPVVSPSAIVRAAAWPHLDAGAARKRVVPPVVVPAPVPPPASARPSVPYSPPAPPAPLLTLPAQVDLGVYMGTTIQVGNPRDQAVSWTVDCGPDVNAVPAFGVLEPGQQGVQVRLDINPTDGQSAAVCQFEPGGERLVVTWAGAGSPSSAS